MKFIAPIALALAGSTVNALSLKKAETAVVADEITKGPLKNVQKPLQKLNKISKNLVEEKWRDLMPKSFQSIHTFVF